MAEDNYSWQEKMLAFLKIPTIIASTDDAWEPRPSGAEHWHDFYQLDYFYRGYGSVVIAGLDYPVKPGDIFVCNPSDEHEGTAASEHPMESIMSQFDLIGADSRPRLPNYVGNVNLLSRDQQREMERFLRQAGVEANRPGQEGAHLSAALFSVFFMYLLRYLGDTRNLSLPESEMSRTQRVLEYIKGHYDRRIVLSDLARIAGVHPKYLCHTFKTEFGTSPIAALTAERMEAARRLLANTRLPIAEIGSRVGYDDVYHFSRRFKEVIGISPRQFRETPASESRPPAKPEA